MNATPKIDMNEEIVVGVDIGTTKVCAVVAAEDDLGRVNILGVGLAESNGLNRGVVVNIDRTVEAVQEAVNEAERAAGVEVHRVIVGIAGDHVQSFQSRGVVAISNRNSEITQRDVQRLLEDTMHVALPADREILHVIPQEFIVDGTDDIRKGLGVMRDQAEQLKRQFGTALIDVDDAQEEITIPGIGGRPEKSIGRDTLAQIIQPRMEEILEIAAIEIKRSGYGRHLAVGAVLTGGGSLIPGTAELAADVLNMEARIGRPMGLAGGLVEEVSDPKFATGVGLGLYGMRPEVIGGAPFDSSAAARTGAMNGRSGDTLFNKITDRMKSWFDEL
mgnify:CR=1 FL=1